MRRRGRLRSSCQLFEVESRMRLGSGEVKVMWGEVRFCVGEMRARGCRKLNAAYDI